VARVGTALVEDVETLLKRSGREHGFEGRIIVIGDEDLGPGDVRIEWADGGVARDRASFERALAAAWPRPPAALIQTARTGPDRHDSHDGPAAAAAQ
jgi:flagellar assembly protein FliH